MIIGITYSQIEHLFRLTCRSFDTLGLAKLWMVRLHHILAETVILIWGRHGHSFGAHWIARFDMVLLHILLVHTATTGDVGDVCSALLDLRRAWQTCAMLSMLVLPNGANWIHGKLLTLKCLVGAARLGMQLLAEASSMAILLLSCSCNLLLLRIAAQLLVTRRVLQWLLLLIAVAVVWHAEVTIFIFAESCQICTLPIINLTCICSSSSGRSVAHWLIAVICLKSLALIVISSLLLIRSHVFLRSLLWLSGCCTGWRNALLASWGFHRCCIVINWRVLLGLRPYTPTCNARLNLLLLRFR